MSERPGRPAACGRFHEDATGAPLYPHRFDDVLPFHPDGIGGWLAPVRSGDQAWHIDPSGAPAYSARWWRAFGFYEGRAATVDASGWLHIDTSGAPISPFRHAFAGNFQEGRAVVCGADGRYRHIDPNGKPAYSASWRYCGDFREGVAVVQRDDGLHGHVDIDGAALHGGWFLDLDVFHKGFARARDETGWHHVDRRGVPLYTARYAMVEPFYNGCARVERADGAQLVIDESGAVLRMLREPRVSALASLSADMVGYWRTFCIAAAVEIGLPEALPGRIADLAQRTGTIPERLEALLEALAELGLSRRTADGWWRATERGALLRADHPKTLADAAREYAGPLLAPWTRLPDVLRGASPQTGFFETLVARADGGRSHHRMLESYALDDYAPWVPLLPIPAGACVFDAGGGSGALAGMIRAAHPEAQVSVGDMPGAPVIDKGAARVDFDLFSPWPISADCILLARVLHDWSDDRCVEILTRAATALRPDGEIFILEMLRPENSHGGALCGLHLLVNSGGRERQRAEYSALCESAGLRIRELISGGGLISCLRVGP